MKDYDMHRDKIFRIVSAMLVITLLAAMLIQPGAGRADADASVKSYIVQATDTDLAARMVEEHGGVVTSRLEIINGVGATLTQETAELLLTLPGIKAVTPNSPVQASGKKRSNPIPATDYPDVVGADVVWSQGVNGSDVTVAIVDTGIGLHPGLVLGINKRIKDRIIAWKDFVDNRRLPFDPNGHGTHIAGIIANSQIGNDSEWNGVAPGVSLVGVRVLDETGFGTYERVIQGLQWVIKNKNRYNIRVVNLSLVSPVQSPYWADPLNQAVMKAWAAGIVVVVSAGNGGPEAMTIGVPGNNPYVITVGAFTDNYTPTDWNDDYIAPFSAAGPTLDGFVKPDVVAPGAHMLSTVLPSTRLDRKHRHKMLDPMQYYFEMAGTSQAAAVVSGVAALILSQNPSLTPDEIKYRLMYSAFPWVDPNTSEAGYSIWQQGAGRVNAPDAVNMTETGMSNQGMDIQADLAGTQHYEGFSYYDETTGQYRLRGDFSDWNGKFWAWDGGFGLWSGGFGSWSGGFGLWSGGFGSWSGGFGLWSGGFGSWSGGFGSWSGGFGSWSGGFGSWSGGFGSWSGSLPWSDTVYADPAFIARFMAGESPDASSAVTSINDWVEEP